MNDFSTFLGITTSVFTIVLLVVGIILGIKLIKFVTRAERILDDVEEKVDSINGVFNVITKASNGLEVIGTRLIDSVVDLFCKIFKKKKEEDDYE